MLIRLKPTKDARMYITEPTILSVFIFYSSMNDSLKRNLSTTMAVNMIFAGPSKFPKRKYSKNIIMSISLFLDTFNLIYIYFVFERLVGHTRHLMPV